MLLFFVLYSIFVMGQRNAGSYKVVNSKQLKKQELLTISTSNKQDKRILADSLFDRCNSFIKNAEFTKALSAIEQALHIYELLGEDKLIGNCYNKIAFIHYYQGNYDAALQYFDKSIEVYQNIGFAKGVASSTNNTGAIYYSLGNYPKALDCYKKAVKLNEVLNDEKQTAATIQNIGGIYLEMNDYDNAMKHFVSAKKTYESISDKKTLSQVLIAIGEIYLRQEEFPQALAHFEEALKLATQIDDKQRTLESIYKLGQIYGSQKEYKVSLEYYGDCLKLANEIENSFYISSSLVGIGVVNYKLGKYQIATADCKKGLQLAKKIKIIPTQKEACKCLYDTYKSLNQNRKALAYYEQNIRLKDSLQVVQTSDKLRNMEFEKQVLLDSIVNAEKKRKLQTIHEQEVAEQEKQRNVLIISGCFMLILAGGLWNRLRFTKKAKAILQVEKDLSEHLLLNILPKEIAEELKEKGYVDAQDFDTASILFTDFKSFTETASKLNPQELVEEINVCFKAFDGIMETYGIEKIKTIGDAYMAVGGLPKPDTKAVKNIIIAALDMQSFIAQRKEENENQNKPAFEMRVGIHVGPIVAGIVGVKKFQYDIWGDTVNTASRMESNGAVGKVNISQFTYLLVKDEVDLGFEYRGKITVKGKGNLAMYFVSKKET